jgi:Rad and Gem related GTP binding protein 1
VFYSADDEFGEKSVSVLLDGEESEIIFIDHPSSEMSVSLFRSFVFL